ncbi:MAG TPA: STAS domain-containing protein [Methylomusa anaerophila]|uniref:Anti-sigma factor antagonist n=1 Tax=Methylomusa anaerophila TaxID=1930071 RepID=A0A348AJD6_9FIRM|nr:STAS domain-containing protein [Methylomusa anaerophila]BBB91184.1 putative anti-sigma factor antagonist [Methylomusa anaerophila]HML89061.1 STAS domain-containing protein [Methylomusa anaerophila]
MIQEITLLNDQVHVSLAGSIYAGEAAAIREKLVAYIDKGHNQFVIRVDQVDYIDSSGLGMLVAIQKRAVQNGGGVIIKGLRGIVKELFELTRLTKVFEIQ